ncbi:MAG TPA: zinc ABC transporter substrate-binding protein, partial [Herpetosiphonaceae bacterium]|nr:zinc ABC transporter substrate-binding protein [Herpetosiphonaceae bacterium]
EDADIVFYGGLHLEGRMAEIFEKQAERGLRTVAVTRDIAEERLRTPPEFAGNHDPHIWFDVTLWEEAVSTVADQLAALDPGSAALYRSNAEAYLNQLDELDRYIMAEVATVAPESRVLITAHDAFGYFGDRYGFEVRGLQGISTASEAGAGDVQGLADFIAERRIKAIFVESSVPQATIEAVQQAVNARGWQVAIGGELFSDAMGNQGTPEGTYIGMVRHNVDTIVGALK